jgi:chemotaxis protein histidine kinase CheA
LPRALKGSRSRSVCKERGRPSGSRLDLVHAILSQDFSTRREVTETSGRGVGMAAVAAVVSELGGTLTVESQFGEGTRWTASFAQLSSPSP